MKLSKLVYECVRDSISLPNPNFNYVSFVNGDYNDNKDYIRQISGVFGALNLALSRLYDNNKIPYSTINVKVKDNGFSFTLGEVINVVKIYRTNYKRYEFRTLNQGRDIVLFSKDDIPEELTVEYRPFIKHFDMEDISKIDLNKDNLIIIEDNNIELEDYGIKDNMCSYIKEFVGAQLTEFIDPTISNNHNNRAEQYFQTLKQASTSFYQANVKVRSLL